MDDTGGGGGFWEMALILGMAAHKTHFLLLRKRKSERFLQAMRGSRGSQSKTMQNPFHKVLCFVDEERRERDEEGKEGEKRERPAKIRDVFFGCWRIG